MDAADIESRLRRIVNDASEEAWSAVEWENLIVSKTLEFIHTLRP